MNNEYIYYERGDGSFYRLSADYWQKGGAKEQDSWNPVTRKWVSAANLLHVFFNEDIDLEQLDHNPVVDLENWRESYGSGFLKFLVDERLAIPDLFDRATLTVECDLIEVEFSLSKILDHLKSDMRRWILIVQTTSAPRLYVQVLINQEGGLWSECVSDFYLEEEFKLSEEQRETFPALGWEWPSPPAKQNWHFHDELMDTGSAVSGLLVRTLRTVFHCDDNDPLEVRVFPSSNKD